MAPLPTTIAIGNLEGLGFDPVTYGFPIDNMHCANGFIDLTNTWGFFFQGKPHETDAPYLGIFGCKVVQPPMTIVASKLKGLNRI